MPPPLATLLEPRKSPVQARSTASVDAILEATLQVLLGHGAGEGGKDRLTTTRVAARAGVSVGTLYQYFPNKSALLQAVLRRHMNEVTAAVEQVCLDQRGQPLAVMATALIDAFLRAKMADAPSSVALYSISSDIDGARIAQAMQARCNCAILALFVTSSQTLTRDPALVVSMLQGAMAGVSRRLLESGDPEEYLDPLRKELIFFATSYLAACTA